MQKIKSSLTGRLGGYTKEMMKDLNVPGAAVAIIKDREIILSEGFGYRDIENKKPVTPSTLFAIGSSTKAFGTLSLSLLAQQQKFNWDKSVQTYIPAFSLHDPLASSQTTARNLASHRSGVSRHELLWYGSSLTRKDIAEKIQYLELDAIDWRKRAIEDTAKFKEMMKELDKPLPQVKETTLTHAVEEYTGIFEHPAYGKMEVYKQNDTLYLKWESVNIEMKHHHYNVYTTKWNLSHTEMTVLIAYEMDVEGELSQFKLHLPPMLSTKPIVFSRLTDRIS
ncbi:MULTISPECIES: serine hydrolase [Priestia]|uniref:serine hydrolase n=1 Tax=Priestia TaxID=2800373 RepID=UPI001F427C54|nr:serine hydrolase [Priestia megaterium]MCF8888615.1 serine hydrolase [Priestia megaterium]